MSAAANVIILAAGKSLQLDGISKALIRHPGSGKTVLDYAVDAFAGKRIAFLVADWTNRNPAITALLEAHQRSGVPLYLYYAPDAVEAVVLPQIFTEGEVLQTIGAK